MSSADMPRDCKHGQLARSCEICELEAEVGSLRVELAEAKRCASLVLTDHLSLFNEGEALRAQVAQLKDTMRADAEREIQFIKAAGDEVDALKTQLAEAWQTADHRGREIIALGLKNDALRAELTTLKTEQLLDTPVKKRGRTTTLRSLVAAMNELGMEVNVEFHSPGLGLRLYPEAKP